MHELSIAMNIVEIAEDQCRSNGGKKVLSINLEVGLLSGVVVDALKFALESATQATLMDRAVINIEATEGLAECIECGTRYPTNDYISTCPTCNSFRNSILQGKELRVKSLEIE